jgi:sugar phosphate isomerase/epimerase
LCARGDQHVAPYVGNIDWLKFIETLKAIEYGGVFSLEIHHYIQRMPPEMVDDVARIAYRIGRHLVEM